MKLLCYFLATKSPRTLDAYLCWRSSEIISIFIPFSLMQQISLLFHFCWFETIKCLAFLSWLGCQVFFLKTKDDATTIKPRKNVMMFDYKSPRVNTAEFCQNVLMVSVVFEAWWLPLITNVNIISINLTQWISLFRKIWVFTVCVNDLRISGHNTAK